jgi:hypothetical protein
MYSPGENLIILILVSWDIENYVTRVSRDFVRGCKVHEHTSTDNTKNLTEQRFGLLVSDLLTSRPISMENIILSEVSLAQKTKNHMFSLICGH